MAFKESERTDIRRFCGYPVQGADGGGLHGWRFYQSYGLLEYRMQRLTGSEEAVVRRYLASLAALERGVTEAAANLDTDRASVWERNRDEVRDRTRLFDDWRRRLCGFLGVPPGPALGTGGTGLVV